MSADVKDLVARLRAMNLAQCDDAASALEEQAEEIARLMNERNEAVSELLMKWCMACGTLTNDDECDCTMYGDEAMQDFKPYIEEYARSMREGLSEQRSISEAAERERDALKAENERLREALRGLLIRVEEPDEEYGPNHAVTVARAALHPTQEGE